MTILRCKDKMPLNVGMVVKADPVENALRAMKRYIHRHGIPDYWLVPPRLEGFAGLRDGRLMFARVKVQERGR